MKSFVLTAALTPALVVSTAVTLLFANVGHAQTKAPVGNAAAGSQKIEMCIGCHGITGWRTAYPEVYHVPKLGGQHAPYITQALKEYRAGERAHPSMRAIAATLSDQDIADLAAYYSATLANTAEK
jgi:cytochrome c553